ncbi:MULTISPECIES: carboxymuconolactone decarboxylase family protein [Nonomuraea]|uniref:Carboxymuconolactone decarboxylase family protein n=2 Tax=Nonomuraea TaxID=83681 RepID=A0ABW1BZ75_9ACTN|nr:MULTISPECIES: carboxymuconolactone decarboxylase family protein [Nonomuraea]MDA0645968.1 carboxymuconolactone decarboxylase family protein [Nonomuraea ferruginea]
MPTDEPQGLIPMLPVEEAARIAVEAGMREEMSRIFFYRLLLNSPQSARVENEINDRILWEGRLTRRPEATRLRELAIMRVAWVTGSTYLWAHHYAPTVDVDLPGKRPADVLGVREGAAYEGFGPAERAVMRAVDEMARDDRVSEKTLGDLKEVLANDGEVVEICYVIAIWRALTMLMDTFQVPLEPGYQPWAPDGRRPGEEGR